MPGLAPAGPPSHPNGPSSTRGAGSLDGAEGRNHLWLSSSMDRTSTIVCDGCTSVTPTVEDHLLARARSASHVFGEHFGVRLSTDLLRWP
jgi:hypothetical protein